MSSQELLNVDSTTERVSPESRSSRKPKRPDMKFYTAPHGAKSNSSVSSQEGELDQVKSSRSRLQFEDEEPHSRGFLSVPSSSTSQRSNESLSKSRPSSCEDNIIVNRCYKQESKSLEADSWDAIFNDDGECIDQTLANNFKKSMSITKESSTNITRPRSSFGHYSMISNSGPSNDPTNYEADFGHVLELYNCGPEVKMQDVRASLGGFSPSDFDIKWVNDNHAILVFCSKEKAQEALKMGYADFRLRKINQGIWESKTKAKNLAQLPYKERPETSAILARRLVSGALGLRVNISPEQRAAERKKLQDARERKKNQKKQSTDIWEGNVK